MSPRFPLSLLRRAFSFAGVATAVALLSVWPAMWPASIATLVLLFGHAASWAGVLDDPCTGVAPPATAAACHRRDRPAPSPAAPPWLASWPRGPM